MKIKVYHQFIANRQENHLYRDLSYADNLHNTSLIDFSSNHYLGLSLNQDYTQEIAQAAYQASLHYGIGAGASRFVTGNHNFFMQVEQRLARLKKRQAVFVGASGYQMNMSVIPALLNKDLFDKPPLVIFDKANHASMYQGVKLAGTELVRFKHNDFNHLEDLLKKYTQTNRQIFIMTESLYSMDGDVCDFTALIALAKQHHAFTLVDDAHSTGIMGQNGAGLASEYPDIDIIIGTISKALNLQGGYVACSQAMMDYLYNSASGFIYSTAISPFIWGALNKVLDLLPNLESERIDVQKKSVYLRQKLHEIDIDTLHSTTHIIPAIMKNNTGALHIEKKLYDNGFIAKAIRSPTVPYNSPRLRLTLNPFITYDMIDNLTTILKENL